MRPGAGRVQCLVGPSKFVVCNQQQEARREPPARREPLESASLQSGGPGTPDVLRTSDTVLYFGHGKKTLETFERPGMQV